MSSQASHSRQLRLSAANDVSAKPSLSTHISPSSRREGCEVSDTSDADGLMDIILPLLDRGREVAEQVYQASLGPLRVLTSKSAQKAYLGTFLFTIASLGLLAISSTAYGLFYWKYLPDVSVERVIYLQFSNGSHPHGTTSLSNALTSFQPYDITLHLHLPRTPANLGAGNFMLALTLLGPTITNPSTNAKSFTYVESRRSAILTYNSRMVDTASTLSGLPWYVLGWKTESEVLKVPMFEGVIFKRGKGELPERVELVVEADEKMQFYEVGVKVVARFGGLRWIMYHYRILSFLIFTAVFWTSSMTSTLLAWLLLASYYPSPSQPPKKEEQDPTSPLIKSEPEEDTNDPSLTEGLSDTSRTFPTIGRYPKPLHFTAAGRSDANATDVKQEEDLPL
ncbi:MAG: hypothetical protein Q9183_006140, partial [Haloplaca sp. 2 TL-2023]